MGSHVYDSMPRSGFSQPRAPVRLPVVPVHLRQPRVGAVFFALHFDTKLAVVLSSDDPYPAMSATIALVPAQSHFGRTKCDMVLIILTSSPSPETPARAAKI